MPFLFASAFKKIKNLKQMRTGAHAVRHAQSGRTMLEVLMALLIMGMISVGGYAGVRYALGLSQAWRAQAQVNQLGKDVISLYAWQDSYATLSMQGGRGICNTIVSPGNQDCKILSPWNEEVRVSKGKSNASFKIVLTKTPRSICEHLKEMRYENVYMVQKECTSGLQDIEFVMDKNDRGCEGGCPTGYDCINGECRSQDREEACENVSCGGECLTGECRGGVCLRKMNGTSCSIGVCQDGMCVEETTVTHPEVTTPEETTTEEAWDTTTTLDPCCEGNFCMGSQWRCNNASAGVTGNTVRFCSINTSCNGGYSHTTMERLVSPSTINGYTWVASKSNNMNWYDAYNFCAAQGMSMASQNEIRSFQTQLQSIWTNAGITSFPYVWSSSSFWQGSVSACMNDLSCNAVIQGIPSGHGYVTKDKMFAGGSGWSKVAALCYGIDSYDTTTPWETTTTPYDTTTPWETTTTEGGCKRSFPKYSNVCLSDTSMVYNTSDDYCANNGMERLTTNEAYVLGSAYKNYTYAWINGGYVYMGSSTNVYTSTSGSYRTLCKDKGTTLEYENPCTTSYDCASDEICVADGVGQRYCAKAVCQTNQNVCLANIWTIPASEAQLFCQRVGKRIATKEEWMYSKAYSGTAPFVLNGTAVQAWYKCCSAEANVSSQSRTVSSVVCVGINQVIEKPEDECQTTSDCDKGSYCIANAQQVKKCQAGSCTMSGGICSGNISVSSSDASAFCSGLGYRLATKAELTAAGAYWGGPGWVNNGGAVQAWYKCCSNTSTPSHYSWTTSAPARCK